MFPIYTSSDKFETARRGPTALVQGFPEPAIRRRPRSCWTAVRRYNVEAMIVNTAVGA